MKILITGARGIIGSVLMKCLAERHSVIGIDRDEAPGVMKVDMCKDPEAFAQEARGRDVIIHCAWDARESGTLLNPSLEENRRMGETLYEKALYLKVPRVILLSSVHASFGFLDYLDGDLEKNHKERFHREKKVTVEDGFCPSGTYGAVKIYLEALGSAYAKRGLQVVAVRFGNVTKEDTRGEYPFWLSHRDCCQFIEKCCTVKNLPAFSTFFAVSKNICNPFNMESARVMLGYESEDGSTCPFS